jgi:hypothetical protein
MLTLTARLELKESDEYEASSPMTKLNGLDRRRWYQYSLRSMMIAVTLFSAVMSGFGWFYRFHERRRMTYEIEATVRSLAKKRPPTMTRGQWGSAVAWTENLTGNSELFDAKSDELLRFQSALEEKAKGNVDMVTILWIWDQQAHLTPAGKEYQTFRKQMLDEIAAVGPNDDPWGMNVP